MSKITAESRADYMKSRREKFKAFHVEVDKEKMEKLEKKLSENNQTKKEWLDSKIDETIGEIKGI